MSPIRFAARQQDQFKPKRTAEEYYEEDDYDDDGEDLDDIEDVLSPEGFKVTAPRVSASSTAHLLPKLTLAPEGKQEKDSTIDPACYVLISFSTGLLLEDRLPLEAYTLQPHELLELHRHPFVTMLPRHKEEEYILPFFEARVSARKSVIKQSDADRLDSEGRHESFAAREKLSKRRRKFGWSDRWLVIHKGRIRLSRHRTVSIS